MSSRPTANRSPATRATSSNRRWRMPSEWASSTTSAQSWSSLFKPDTSGRPAPVPHDDAGYFDVSTDLATHIRRHMVRALAAFDIEVEAAHHEVAVGQHEIYFKYGPALRTADHAVTFRTTLKAVAQQHNLYATFMPKPISRINGSGMHVHQSLSDA